MRRRERVKAVKQAQGRRMGVGECGEVEWRTFLDLSFLHLVVDRLLEVSFVTIRKSVNVDLRLSLIHRRFVWRLILLARSGSCCGGNEWWLVVWLLRSAVYTGDLHMPL